MLLVKSAPNALSVHKQMQQLCAQKVLNSLVKDPRTECRQHWVTWALLLRTLHGLQQRGIADSDQQWNGLYLGIAQYCKRPWVVWGGCDGVHCKWKGLHPTVRSVSGQTNILPTVIRFVNTHGDHINMTKQVTTSCSHHFAGIRASTTTYSTKHSSNHPSAIICGSLDGQRHGTLDPLFCR